MPSQRELLVQKMVAEGTSDDDIRATLRAFDAQGVSTSSQSGTETTTPPNTNSALAMAGASRIVPMIEKGVEAGVKAALAAPNAPRIIQRSIGAGVRAATTAVGAAIGGVPGAIAGAAASEGLTPTQSTIRGWLGRTASAAPQAGDAVANYIQSMGADAANLTGSALEYAKKAGRAIIYDATGRASLVPAQVAQNTQRAATSAVSRGASAIGKGLSVLSGAQGVNDLAQMAEPDRQDIGVLGVGKSPDDIDQAVMVMMQKIQQGMKPMDAARQATAQMPSLYPQVINRWARIPK